MRLKNCICMHSFDMVEVRLRLEYALVDILLIYDPDLASTCPRHS